MSNARELEIAEFVAIVASVLGTGFAAVTQQVAWVATPLTIGLGLNFYNRQRLWELNRKERHGEMEQLYQQIELLAPLEPTVKQLQQEIPDREQIENIQRAIVRLQQSSLPRTEADGLLVALSQLQKQIPPRDQIEELQSAIAQLQQQSQENNSSSPTPTTEDGNFGQVRENLLNLGISLKTLFSQLATPEGESADGQFQDKSSAYNAAHGIHTLAISADGKILARDSSSYEIALQEVGSGKELGVLEGHSDYVDALAFHPKTPLLASGSADGTIKLWDVETKEVRKTLRGHRAVILAFSPDGTTLASGSPDATIKFWDVETGIEKQTLSNDNDGITTLSFHPQKEILAVGTQGGRLQLWNLQTGEKLGEHQFIEFKQSLRAIAFSPDGKHLASGGDDPTIHLWNVPDLIEQQTLKQHTFGIRTLAFSPDGNFLASGSSDKTINLWDLKTVAVRETFTGHRGKINAIAFSPNQPLLASGSSDSCVKFWQYPVSETTETP
ncbi:hypothetical protein [Lusitaniella coriacea]|uniref:WD40 repeat domain-containing protein n=1 Tax=Lusitaniella coriacea TaxID=1983105 RepID=UPI003CF09BE1